MSDSTPLTDVSSQRLRIPVFYVGATLRRRMEEDLVDERRAIKSLREMLPILAQDDPNTRPLVEAILAVEEARFDELSDLLEGTRR